ncbi:hypothetical protein LIER_01900 [Lithospermum erythrorhizon]|uniref:Uncharacterized protein n=1 Tax=Lithospermum erythrorhizon TaxID=34254 RepID=A0AAV3NN21_LITER
MSQSLENHMDNFEICPRTGANQEDASVSGGMLVLQPTDLIRSGTAAQGAGVANLTYALANPDEAERAEAAYRGIMTSLPAFIKKSIRPNLTNDQLDGITSYFFIPHDKVDTHLALRGEQVYLPHIENNSFDPDLTHGYTLVYVEVFTYGMRLPFSSFVNNLLIAINRAPANSPPLADD